MVMVRSQPNCVRMKKVTQSQCLCLRTGMKDGLAIRKFFIPSENSHWKTRVRSMLDEWRLATNTLDVFGRLDKNVV